MEGGAVMLSPKKVALRYAQLEKSVFPCYEIVDGHCACGKKDCGSPGKHPRTLHGVKDASKDPQQIEAWWDQWPDANIAIATGKESGVIVLDVDKHGGFESLKQLEDEHTPLPETPWAMTGGGGEHRYFAYTPGIKNAVGILPGLDLRSDGGYVICPYSNHISGQAYEWEANSTLTALPLAPLPEYIVKLIKEERKTQKPEVEAAAVLDGVQEGKRDDTLFRYACSLRARGMNPKEARLLVLAAAQACTPPFPDKDAQAKVTQAWRYSPSVATMLLEIVSHPPAVQGTSSTYTLTWGEDAIIARISRLKEHSNGDISGFLAFTTTLPGMPPKIHQAKFNFASTQSRVSLAKVLHQRAPALDQNRWLGIVETLCDTLIERLQEGEPPVVLGVEDVDPKPIPYILSPIVPAYEPTVIFGMPNALKSYLLQYLVCLITIGESDADLKLISEREPIACLYLDWEDSEDRLRQRFSLLQRGQGLPKKEIYYQRCSRPLADDVDRLQGLITRYDIGFVAVDSLGPACGGDLNAAQPAIAFFNALRSLRVSSVITAHRAKNGEGRSSPYGSIFFSALGRSVWEMISHQEEGSSEAEVGLFHRCSNLSRLEPPKGLRFIFDDNNGTTTIRPQEVGSIPGVRESVTLSGQIYRLLTEVGVMTVREIADDLDKSTESVRTTIKRMRDLKRVTQLADKKWGVLVGEESPFKF